MQADPFTTSLSGAHQSHQVLTEILAYEAAWGNRWGNSSLSWEGGWPLAPAAPALAPSLPELGCPGLWLLLPWRMGLYGWAEALFGPDRPAPAQPCDLVSWQCCWLLLPPYSTQNPLQCWDRKLTSWPSGATRTIGATHVSRQ